MLAERIVNDKMKVGGFFCLFFCFFKDGAKIDMFAPEAELSRS